MKLSDILSSEWINLAEVPAVTIENMTLDSRAVTNGTLFIALNRGVEFIAEAVARGASAILIEVGIENLAAIPPVIVIPDLQQRYGFIASRFYGNPSEQLTVIGITGTNGKTSSSHYVAQLLQQTVGRCGIIGTLGVGELGQLIDTGLTTPDAIKVQQTLKQFLQQGINYVVMEVSSHALEQGRVNGVVFDTAIFTNLTHDHLDYHHSMAAYGAAKAKLFTEFQPINSIINADDAFGKTLLNTLQNAISYSTSSADIFTKNLVFTSTGAEAEFISPWGEGNLVTQLLGEFNVSNIIASITAVAMQGIALQKILAAVKHVKPVAGRMECFYHSNKPVAIVDYAHTPDALAKALQAARQHSTGKLWCVFGCGGNRDRSKRSVMADVAETYAEYVVVTSDNPRHENPNEIIADIMTGFTRIKPHIEADRRSAIEYAIKQANVTDVILIAGKGHEDYQIIGDTKYHFSDAEVVQSCFD